MSGTIDFSQVHSTVDLTDKILAVKANNIAGNVTVQQLKENILSSKGQPNGLAELDSNGKIPTAQLPSYVDDVYEYSSYETLPREGESGKVYVTIDTNKVYRWSGTTYVEISQSVQLGESEWTAYRGDRGKVAYEHTLNKNNPHNVTKRDIGLSNVDNTSDINKPISLATNSAINQLNDKIESMNLEKFDGGYVENGVLYLTANNEVKLEVTGIGGGGAGGGSGNNAKLTVTKVSDYFSKTITEGSSLIFEFDWSSMENEEPTGNGGLVIRNNNSVVLSKNIEQGRVAIDLKDYLVVGSNQIKMTVNDVYDNTRNISLNINVASLVIKSFFDDSEFYTSPIKFTYTAMGNYTKVVHFLVDGEEVGSELINGTTQQTHFFDEMTHGDHDIEVYYTTTIDGEEVSSNHLKYNVIYLVEGNRTPVISATFENEHVRQYDNLAIKYQVYTPNELYSSITLSDGVNSTTLPSVDRDVKLWSYIVENSGDYTLTITCGSVVKVFEFSAEPSSINVEAVDDYLELHLSSYGRNNSEEHPETWNYGDIESELTNFNFISDGWVNDADGIVSLKVTGDARVNIPFNVFENNFTRDGKTIEIEFSTTDVRDYDTEIISCWSGDRGFKVTPQSVIIKSEGTEMVTQFKEDEHIRLTFTIEKQYEDRLILCYLNGICSSAIQYPELDDFTQRVPVGISIGSNLATTNIYNIRVYETNLSRKQVLDNWIADTQVGSLKALRYNRNNIYDEYDNVSLNQLPSDVPYFIFEADVLPQSKGDVKVVKGSYTDPMNPSKSFTFEGAECDVQGTSSQYYARKNYKVKFKNGFIVNGVKQSKYALTSNSIPVSTFCFKADVASSEGANNVELVRLYNDIAPKTPPQNEDSRVRQGIEGYPMVVFQSVGGELKFLGKYNFNNDKSTSEVYGFESGNESWEFLNNVSDRVNFISADFNGDGWKEDFEARYPDTKPAYTDTTKLAEMIAWVASTNTEGLTGAEREAKIQKFRDELEQYFDKDSLIFNYLFSEFFLMVDNRAKNIFPSVYNDGKWYIIPYDYDTAIGTDNVGDLKFDYHYETGDNVEGTDTPVFAGSRSVLFNNVKEAFEDEITEMYKSLRSSQNNIFSYDTIEKRFEDHQAKWSEAIFNEDAWFKYLQPLVDDNDNAYISMLQGSKEQQRKWWLYNRFKYMDSKFVAGQAASDVITLRCYSPQNLELTPYADIYATVFFEGTKAQERARRSVPCTIANPMAAMNNTPVYIYSASQLKDIGDISGLKVGYANFTFATKLQNLKIGSGADGYSNPNLTELYVGNNNLLSTIDVRNCINLTQSVDLSGCSNIEEVLFDGTSVVGVSLPNGGVLKTLHLPDTVTNLTVRNQKALNDFVLNNPSNVSTLWLEDNSDAIDVLDLLTKIKSDARVRVYGFEKDVVDEQEIADFIDSVSTMRSLDGLSKAELSGVINIPTISYENYEKANNNPDFPYLRVSCDNIICKVKFLREDGSEIVTLTSDNGIVSYPYTNPTKGSTPQYTYAFDCWVDEFGNEVDLNNIHKNYVVSPRFTASLRSYTVSFYNGSTLLETESVPYGSVATYTGTTPVYNGPDASDWGEFTGWNPSDLTITGDTTFTAKFRSLASITRKFVQGNLLSIDDSEWDEADKPTSIRYWGFTNSSGIKYITLSAVTDVGENAFSSCGDIVEIRLPKVTHISRSAFSSTSKLLSIYVGTEANAVCTLDSTNAFSSTSRLKAIYVPDNLVDAYKSATNWSNYSSKIKGVSEANPIDLEMVLDGTTSFDGKTYDVYTLNTGLIWGASNETGATGTELGTGLSNSNTVLSKNIYSTYLEIWDYLRVVRGFSGFENAFIPSVNELKQHKPSDTTYWTSSESSNSYVYFGSSSGTTYKSNSKYLIVFNEHK